MRPSGRRSGLKHREIVGRWVLRLPLNPRCPPPLFFLFSMQYLACSSVLLALTSQAPALLTFSLHSIILSSWCVCGCVCMYVCRATKPFSLPRQPIPPSDPDCRDPAKPLSLPPSFLFFFFFFFLPACPCPCPCPKFSSFPLSGFTHFTHLTYLNIVIIPSPILALHTNRLLFFFFFFFSTHSLILNNHNPPPVSFSFSLHLYAILPNGRISVSPACSFSSPLPRSAQYHARWCRGYLNMLPLAPRH